MEIIKVKDVVQYLDKEIISCFLVTQKEFREGAKDYYIRLRLGDKTGSLIANIWKKAKEVVNQFQEGDVVKIKANVINYKGQTQLSISKIKLIPEEEYNILDFLASTNKDLKELSAEFYSYVDSIKNEYLKKLLNEIFDTEFFAKFIKSPAAKSWHHNYLGGLLEHSVGVARVCDFSANHYPVDRDLVVTGGLLHDIGKVYEYSSDKNIDFTPEGRLLGHINIGDNLICKVASKINNFPDNLLMKLRHLILSHHGEYEKASCRLPQTIEAVVLHFADNLDAQTTGVQQLIEPVKNSTSEWSEFDRINNRFYYIR